MIERQIFADGRMSRKHHVEIRRDRVNLRIIVVSELIDFPSIDVGVMNQRINHSCGCLKIAAVEGLG